MPTRTESYNHDYVNFVSRVRRFHKVKKPNDFKLKVFSLIHLAHLFPHQQNLKACGMPVLSEVKNIELP